MAKPAFTLVVIRPFWFPGDQKSYKVGDEITDPALISAILASELAPNCNKVAA